MLNESYEQALCQTLSTDALAADSFPFLHLDLHTTSVADLSFIKEFSITLNTDIDALDAWVIWFDIFFMPSRSSVVPKDAMPHEMAKKGFVAFTTGPYGPETHWKQGILLVDRRKKKAPPLKKDVKIKGQIEYKKRNPKSRHLEVDVKWEAEGGEKGAQKWSID